MKSLAFGQSLGENIGSDGVCRSRFFTGGTGRRVALFDQWTSCLQGEHFKLKLVHPLWSLVAWVADEKTPLPDVAALVTGWLDVRSPTPGQIRLVESVVDGFVRGLQGWSLWNHVGASNRQSIDMATLQEWSLQLSRWFPAIARLHREIAGHFWKPMSQGFGATFEQYHLADEPACRAFLENEFANLLGQASLLAAFATGKGVVARFADRLLVQGKPKDSVADKVRGSLAAAFPGASFNVEVQSI